MIEYILIKYEKECIRVRYFYVSALSCPECTAGRM